MPLPKHQPVEFSPSHPRKFFLPENMVKRLGGQPAAEIMQLLVEQPALQPAEIQQKLNLSAGDYDAYVLTHLFQRELKSQLRLRKQDKRFQKYGSILPGTPEPWTKKPSAKDPPLPPSLKQIKLPAGVSAAEYALKRINDVTPEAVEKLVFLMHHSRQENIQYNAATKLLGLNGIVEVEKSISVIADAEAIIRELNRRGPYKPKTVEDDVDEAEVVGVRAEAQESPDASVGCVEHPGDSGSVPPESPTDQA